MFKMWEVLGPLEYKECLLRILHIVTITLFHMILLLHSGQISELLLSNHNFAMIKLKNLLVNHLED